MIVNPQSHFPLPYLAAVRILVCSFSLRAAILASTSLCSERVLGEEMFLNQNTKHDGNHYLSRMESFSDSGPLETRDSLD